jgi:hypothetical protein
VQDVARDELTRIERALAAVATTERVATALRAYDDRDHAIELLEDDIAIQRLRLVEELRALLGPHARSAMQRSHAA